MSKKQKRNVRVESGSPSQPVSPVVTAAAPAPIRVRASRNEEFNPDYTFVKKDLKKIGIMAVSFISLLVVISFFLR
jgi:hypothetical protein